MLAPRCADREAHEFHELVLDHLHVVHHPVRHEELLELPLQLQRLRLKDLWKARMHQSSDMLTGFLPAKRRGLDPYAKHVQITFPRERDHLPCPLADKSSGDAPEAALEAHVGASGQA